MGRGKCRERRSRVRQLRTSKNVFVFEYQCMAEKETDIYDIFEDIYQRTCVARLSTNTESFWHRNPHT